MTATSMMRSVATDHPLPIPLIRRQAIYSCLSRILSDREFQPIIGPASTYATTRGRIRYVVDDIAGRRIQSSLQP